MNREINDPVVQELLAKVRPLRNNLIARIIPKETKAGRIVLPEDAVEESTLCEVMIPNSEIHTVDGKIIEGSSFVQGMKLRLPKGNCGTQMPESLEGEKWICFAEDISYYIVN